MICLCRTISETKFDLTSFCESDKMSQFVKPIASLIALAGSMGAMFYVIIMTDTWYGPPLCEITSPGMCYYYGNGWGQHYAATLDHHSCDWITLPIYESYDACVRHLMQVGHRQSCRRYNSTCITPVVIEPEIDWRIRVIGACCAMFIILWAVAVAWTCMCLEDACRHRDLNNYKLQYN